ncbi:PRC-barrel domain-containing protein [Pelagovum pacificum]|nr:PRC-barrel domain-containing protein [Pelagovum pacificum]QQA44858.1 PRC-barrel domain-containing protein [Pelagovum pacificum]
MRLALMLATALVPVSLLAQEADTDTATGEAAAIEDSAPMDNTGQDMAATEETMEPATGTGIAMLVKAEDVADADIYTLDENYDEAFWDSGESFGPMLTDLESIGEADDVILDREGQVVGVTVDVGGFLGIGRKDVLLPLSDIRLVPDGDDDLMIITRLTQDQLESQDDLSGVFGDD